MGVQKQKAGGRKWNQVETRQLMTLREEVNYWKEIAELANDTLTKVIEERFNRKMLWYGLGIITGGGIVWVLQLFM